jgi:hypothetical protein
MTINPINQSILRWLIALLLFVSACKKESLIGVPGGPKEETFSGCRLSQIGFYDIAYYPDGSLKILDDWIYIYDQNKVVIYYGNSPSDRRIILLDNKRIPISSISINNKDSVYTSYLYNEDDHLIKVNHRYEMEGMPKREIELIYSYDGAGNRAKVVIYWNDTLMGKVSFKYDYARLDNRKDFFERVYNNPVSSYDFSDYLPVYWYYQNCVGKWNTNLVKEIRIEYNGMNALYALKNYFDAKGNLVKTVYEQNRLQIGTNTFKYACNQRALFD